MKKGYKPKRRDVIGLEKVRRKMRLGEKEELGDKD